MGERPADSFEGETARDLGVFGHVFVVIEVDEVVAERLAKNEPRNHRQKNAHPGHDPATARQDALAGSISFFLRSAALIRAGNTTQTS